MVILKDLINFCNTYLEIEKFTDASLNGLQVEGKADVEKIALGVSSNLKLFQETVSKNCDLIIVHHGILWTKRWQYLTGFQKQRVKFLFDNNLSLAAYHLPLDVHPEIGNNICGLLKLGVKKEGDFGLYEGKPIGFWGKLKGKVSFKRFKEQVEKVFGTRVWYKDFGKVMVETVAFVSGSGRTLLEEAIEKNIDVYITGETTESAPALCEEAGINFITAGHYNTEKFGIMALGEVLEKKFKVKTEFIDIPNSL